LENAFFVALLAKEKKILSASYAEVPRKLWCAAAIAARA